MRGEFDFSDEKLQDTIFILIVDVMVRSTLY